MLRAMSFAIVWMASGSLPALMIWTWDVLTPIQFGLDDLTVTALGALIGPLTLPAALLWDWLDARGERDAGWP
jgi:Na+/H+ antiporter NhaC